MKVEVVNCPKSEEADKIVRQLEYVELQSFIDAQKTADFT